MTVSFHPLEDAGLQASWSELADETEAAPFMRPGWFLAWAKSFDVPVQVATAGDDALAPVLRGRRTIAAPVNAETPDFSFVARDGSARDRLIVGLLAQGPASFLKLGRGDADALGKVAAGRRVIEDLMQRSPYIEIEGTADTYEGSLRGKFVKEVGRRARRMAEEGAVAIEVHDGRADLRALLDEAFQVESTQWKARRGTAITSRPATRSFYERVAAWTADNGWLRLWLLRLDGRAVAFALDLVAESVYYGLKVGYDPEYARFSPGMILQHDTVRYAFDHGLERFEFLGADEPYKLNWTKMCRDRLAVRVYPRGLRGTTAWFGRAVARPAMHRLRSRVRGAGETSYDGAG